MKFIKLLFYFDKLQKSPRKIQEKKQGIKMTKKKKKTHKNPQKLIKIWRPHLIFPMYGPHLSNTLSDI